MTTHQVAMARPYRKNALESIGDASLMLIRQKNFPNQFDERDSYEMSDHDRLKPEHVSSCCKQHIGNTDWCIGYWARKAFDRQIMAFLIDILEADKSIKWTGYRIMGTLNRSTGWPVWTLELFAKHPETDTLVYTGPNAPNVEPQRRNRPGNHAW